MLSLHPPHTQALREVKESLGRVRTKRGAAGTVATVADKAFQLAQVALGHIKIDKAAGANTYRLKMEVRCAQQRHCGHAPASARLE